MCLSLSDESAPGVLQVLIIPVLTRVDYRSVLLSILVFKVALMFLLGAACYQKAYEDTMAPPLQLLSVALLLVDAVLRGGTDTLRSSLPILLIGSDRNTLLTFNAHFSLAYQIALCLGPGFVALCVEISISHAVLMLIGCYTVAMVFITFMPGEDCDVMLFDLLLLYYFFVVVLRVLDILYETFAIGIHPGAAPQVSRPKEKWKLTFQTCRVLVNPLVCVPFVALTAVQGQRLKGILAAVFAKHIIHEAAGTSAGWCLAMQVYICILYYSA